jgi:hypothetical protein
MNVIKEGELPTNLKNHAWAGTLSAKVWGKYKDIVLWYYLVMGLIAIALGVTMENIFDRVEMPVGVIIGSIFMMWSGIGFPIVYQMFLIRRTFIFEWDTTGNQLKLEEALWFKRDAGKYSLDEALYDRKNGLRYLWWYHDREYKWGDGDKVLGIPETVGRYVNCDPYHMVEISQVKLGNNPPTSADMAGIPGWQDAVRTYADKKSRGIQEILQYTAFAIIIAVEVLGIFMLGNRVSEDNPANQPVVFNDNR